MKEMKVRCTFTEEILGTASNDKDIHSEFIASKAPDAPSREEEIEAIGVDAVIEKGKTVFPRNKDGNPILFDYQIKGFFKNAAKAFNYVGGKDKLTAYKSKIDNLIFINERKIELQLPDGADIGDCQRPLRAQTAQGEADAALIAAQAEAEANRKISQSLTPELIEMQKINKWNGDVPQVQGNATPIIDITKQESEE